MAKKDKFQKRREWVRNFLLTLAKSYLAKWLMRRIALFLGVSLTGFVGWFYKFLFYSGLWDKVIVKGINALVDLGYLGVDKTRGHLISKAIEESETDEELEDALNRMR